jgi:hypothetical protein
MEVISCARTVDYLVGIRNLGSVMALMYYVFLSFRKSRRCRIVITLYVSSPVSFDFTVRDRRRPGRPCHP